ncbi:MAG: quinolinate synthase NadA [Clostridiales bacterium]|nr:quinolinate synthase NadA [Clostridiales bacterium]
MERYEVTDFEMIKEIKRLKIEKNAIILAHNYQVSEVQDIADFVGDSFGLSKIAYESKATTIVFCGVHFMAESAKILSPEKKVLLPVKKAGCPMADMITGESIRNFKADNHGVPVVCYVNTSAEVKAESDICCTSSNAVNVVNSLDSDRILFVPDQNLGNYVARQVPEKEIILFRGFCIVHHRVEIEEVDEIRRKLPDVRILAHPECQPEVLEKSDFVGSTSQILKEAKKSSDMEFIIGTEIGMLHVLQKENPEKKFHILSLALVCENMKKTSLKDVYEAIKGDKYEMTLDESLRIRAKKSLERMLEIKE